MFPMETILFHPQVTSNIRWELVLLFSYVTY